MQLHVLSGANQVCESGGRRLVRVPAGNGAQNERQGAAVCDK